MERLIPATSLRFSIALLLLRVVVGVSFWMHGLPKLAHPTSWSTDRGPLPGIPAWLQLIVCLAEVVGGWAVIIGLLTPLFSFLQVCDMFVVTFIVKIGHGAPYLAPRGRGFELEAHLLVGALVLLLCGPGMFSLDAVIANLWQRSLGRRSRH